MNIEVGDIIMLKDDRKLYLIEGTKDRYQGVVTEIIEGMVYINGGIMFSTDSPRANQDIVVIKSDLGKALYGTV